MKIVKFVDIPEQEVIIDISGQEAVEAICDESMTETKGIIYMSPYLIDSMPNIVLDSLTGLMYIMGMEVVMDYKTYTVFGTKQTLTMEQLEALRSYASRNGRYWKQLLRHAWETGDYQADDDSRSLQLVRNTLGPSWLMRFRLPGAA